MGECITMLKLDIFLSCFGTATFKVVTFFTQRFFIELSCDRTAFWQLKNTNCKTFFTVLICLAILGRLLFLWPQFCFGSK